MGDRGVASNVLDVGWNDVFLRGHGLWTSLENVIVGPFIAFISFVCSIGNVPLAAALWHGGISFGGVISFIFADLIALPLVLIYRKYYGAKLALRLFLTFYALMAAAGLMVEGIFATFGFIPKTRPQDIVTTRFEWNYTTFLNIAFIGVFGTLCWLYRNRERLGAGRGYALDPVCGMQVQTTSAPATATFQGQRYWFCSDRCRERFEGNPQRYGDPARPVPDPDPIDKETTMATDPVCGMTVDPATAPAVRSHGGRNYFFCAPGCA